MCFLILEVVLESLIYPDVFSDSMIAWSSCSQCSLTPKTGDSPCSVSGEVQTAGAAVPLLRQCPAPALTAHPLRL